MVVYTYGVFDLFHYGHLEALKKAKSLGDKLIIGVFTDRQAELFKRKPIMTQEERFRLIEGLEIGDVEYLDEIVPSQEHLDELGVKMITKAAGAGWSVEMYPKWKGIYSFLLDYTPGISTSEIIKRIK